MGKRKIGDARIAIGPADVIAFAEGDGLRGRAHSTGSAARDRRGARRRGTCGIRIVTQSRPSMLSPPSACPWM